MPSSFQRYARERAWSCGNEAHASPSGAVVLADRAPGPLRDVRAPLVPRAGRSRPSSGWPASRHPLPLDAREVGPRLAVPRHRRLLLDARPPVAGARRATDDRSRPGPVRAALDRRLRRRRRRGRPGCEAGVDDPSPAVHARPPRGGTSKSSASQYALRMTCSARCSPADRERDRPRRRRPCPAARARVPCQSTRDPLSSSASVTSAGHVEQRPRRAPARRSARRVKRSRSGVALDEAPVEPRELAVLAVAVVVAELRPPDLVAHRQHRARRPPAARAPAGSGPGARAAPRSPGRRSAPRRRSSSCRLCVVAVAVVLAVRLVVLAVVRDDVVEREPVVAGHEVDRLLGLAAEVRVDVGAGRAGAGRPPTPCPGRSSRTTARRPGTGRSTRSSGRPRTSRPGTGRRRPTPRR